MTVLFITFAITGSTCIDTDVRILAARTMNAECLFTATVVATEQQGANQSVVTAPLERRPV
jgi:hypothetical protein